MAYHGSDTPTFPKAVLHHTDAILCTFMHTTVQLHTKALVCGCIHFYETVFMYSLFSDFKDDFKTTYIANQFHVKCAVQQLREKIVSTYNHLFFGKAKG